MYRRMSTVDVCHGVILLNIVKLEINKSLAGNRQEMLEKNASIDMTKMTS